MKNLLKKLRQSRGETLIETLVAVLVMTCASVLLATMLLAASNLNSKAQEQDQSFYNQLTAAEIQQVPQGDSTVSVEAKKEGKSISIDVVLYGDSTGILSYKGGKRS